MLVYLFAHKSAPDSYARSNYVIVIKLKMVVAIATPLGTDMRAKMLVVVGLQSQIDL
jgi:hypothetical protein